MFSYIDNPSADSESVRVFGVLIDLYQGCISLVKNNQVHPPGFGKDAACFVPEEQERQKYASSLRPACLYVASGDGFGIVR